jgi:hypothetical protein
MGREREAARNRHCDGQSNSGTARRSRRLLFVSASGGAGRDIEQPCNDMCHCWFGARTRALVDAGNASGRASSRCEV